MHDLSPYLRWGCGLGWSLLSDQPGHSCVRDKLLARMHQKPADIGIFSAILPPEHARGQGQRRVYVPDEECGADQRPYVDQHLPHVVDLCKVWVVGRTGPSAVPRGLLCPGRALAFRHGLQKVIRPEWCWLWHDEFNSSFGPVKRLAWYMPLVSAGYYYRAPL